MTRLVARVRSSLVLQGSAWIMIGLGTQSVLGFAFWLLGSQVASSAQLGRASALFTAISFVNFASGLGLTVALARHATDRSPESNALFGWAIVATVASSVVGGCAYLAVVDTSATDLVNGSVGGWALFCAYTAATSVGLLVDVRLMAARRWGWLVGRLALAGLVRLPLTQLDVSMSPDLWLYNLMLAPLAVTAVVSVPFLGRMGAGGTSLRRPSTLATVSRYSAVNWLATLSSQAPQFVLPLVVAQTVAPSANANFFLAWTITGMVLLVPGAIAQVLLVEGSKDADVVHVASGPAHDRAREALLFSVGLATVAWLGALVAGPLVASVLGDSYRSLARLLPSLMVAGIPWAITAVLLSQARIRRDQLMTVAVTVTLGAAILIPALIAIPNSGTLGATRAWQFGNLLAALVAIVMHRRALRLDVVDLSHHPERRRNGEMV